MRKPNRMPKCWPLFPILYTGRIHTPTSCTNLYSKYMQTQMNALNDLIFCLRDLINQWFRSWGFWWKESSLMLKITILVCIFSCICLCAYASRAAKQPPDEPHPCWGTPCWLLRTRCERGGLFSRRAGREGWSTGGAPGENVIASWTIQTGPR